MSKKRNLFALLICLVLTFVCLVSCVEVTLSPELAAKQQAETDAQEVLGKLVWDDEDKEKIVSSFSCPLSTFLAYPISLSKGLSIVGYLVEIINPNLFNMFNCPDLIASIG